jgi:lipoprotein-anchoring transpeptidase ErfK/SrfK
LLGASGIPSSGGNRNTEHEDFGNNVPVKGPFVTLLLVLAAVFATQAAEASSSPESRCGAARSLTGDRAYVAYATRPLVALRAPGGDMLARFGLENVNGFPTLFSVRRAILDRNCKPAWYRVQLPLRPNGVTGYVPARSVSIETVRTRIVVDLSARRLAFIRQGRVRWTSRVGIGASYSPTPKGSFYVNQRLVPTYPSGPWGPAALGVSAFSPVFKTWIQGGPIAIHGTNDPSSVGRASSHGCIRLRNGVMLRLFAETPAGTPVLIRA